MFEYLRTQKHVRIAGQSEEFLLEKICHWVDLCGLADRPERR